MFTAIARDVGFEMIRASIVFFIFFFKQKTAYEMRISDWSSDVCSSDLAAQVPAMGAGAYWFVVHCSGHRGADRARSPRWRYRVAPAPVVRQKHGAALVPEPALNPRGVAVRGFWMLLALVVAFPRSEERRVGKECVSTCRSRWSAYHSK